MGGKLHFQSTLSLNNKSKGWLDLLISQNSLKAPEVLLPSTERINVNIIKVTGSPGVWIFNNIFSDDGGRWWRHAGDGDGEDDVDYANGVDVDNLGCCEDGEQVGVVLFQI